MRPAAVALPPVMEAPCDRIGRSAAHGTTWDSMGGMGVKGIWRDQPLAAIFRLRQSAYRSPIPAAIPADSVCSCVCGNARQRNKCQTACKPGSVRTLRCGTTIPLGRASRRASRDQPGRRNGNAPAPQRAPPSPIRSCSRWGLPCRPCCQGRGALLPHRFTLARGLPCGACAGGLFSVALSLGSPPPAVSRHRIPVEPGLSSAACAAAAVRPSGGGTNRPTPRRGQGLGWRWCYGARRPLPGDMAASRLPAGSAG